MKRFLVNHRSTKGFAALFFVGLLCLATTIGLLLSSQSFASGKGQTAFAQDYTQGLIRGDTKRFMDAFSDTVKILPEYDLSFLGKKKARHNTGRKKMSHRNRIRSKITAAKLCNNMCI